MEQQVFVDSGAWIAVTDVRDQYHRNASGFYRQLMQSTRVMVTTNLVIAEAYVAMRRSMGHGTAIRFLQSVHQSRRLLRISSNTGIEERAEAILTRHEDQDFSFTDAVSFAVMQELDITEAFAFDHHFLTAGFTLKPAAA